MIKRILIILLAVLVIIQFFHPAKNMATDMSANDITKVYTVPENVHQILQKSCYDCHSNNTSYPWYNNMQPVAWWLHNHITEGKQHLNFSEFGGYDKTKQAKKLKGVAKTVNEGEMPLGSYLWIHTDAKLSDDQKKIVADWASGLSQQISSGAVTK